MTRKVCLVGPAYPYRGGIAHFTSMLAKEFSRDSDILVINFKRLYPSLFFPGKTQFDESGDPFDVQSIRVIDSLNPFSFITAARRIRAFSPDLIVVQWWHPFFAVALATIALAVGRRLRARFVFLCHNVLPHERSLLDTILIRIAFSVTRRFLVQSEEDRRNLLGLKKSARVEVQPHPIYDTFDGGRFTRDTARHSLGVQGKVLLFFGLIRRYKGLDILLDAFARTQDNLRATLLVVGEFYDDKQPYLSAMDRLGISECVRVVDQYVPNEEVEKYFRACDLVALPYLSATQSGIVQIAFAFDKPVVVTNVGGLPDVVRDGVTGLIVPRNDPDALAGAIIRFFEGDPAVMTRAVAEDKARFSWEWCAASLWALVEDAPHP